MYKNRAIFVLLVLLLPSLVFAGDDYISPRETSDRLVSLETKIDLKFDEIEKNLALAKYNLDYRLQGMNEFQKRMDKLEGTFATKSEVATNSKLIYMGVGLILALQVVLQFILRKDKIGKKEY